MEARELILQAAKLLEQAAESLGGVTSAIETRSIQGNTARSRSIEFGKRTEWKDNLNESKSDIKFDKKYKIQRTAKRRPPIKKIKVQCRKCRKTSTVPETSIYQVTGDDEARYICDNCIGK